MVKVYIALFTCAVMCAIHLGFVENCSDQEFLSAFRRFISVRSVSKLIVSHNAKTSEALNRTLIDMYNNSTVRVFLFEKANEWRLVCEARS